MVLEIAWIGQLSQGEIAFSLSLEEIRVSGKKFEFWKTACMESCALPERIFWARDRSFWRSRSPRKSNPSLTVAPENCKTKKMLEAAVLNLSSQIWKVKTWDLQKPSTPVNSPQSSTSPCKINFSFFRFLVFLWSPVKMVQSTKLEDKIKGIDNYKAWKYKIGLILRENDLEKYIKK